jgi:hypothetical protein
VLQALWRFLEMRMRTDLVGDVTRHLRHAAAARPGTRLYVERRR